MVAASHVWLFKFKHKLKLNKMEDFSSLVALATFQVLSSYIWLVTIILDSIA